MNIYCGCWVVLSHLSSEVPLTLYKYLEGTRIGSHVNGCLEFSRNASIRSKRTFPHQSLRENWFSPMNCLFFYGIGIHPLQLERSECFYKTRIQMRIQSLSLKYSLVWQNISSQLHWCLVTAPIFGYCNDVWTLRFRANGRSTEQIESPFTNTGIWLTLNRLGHFHLVKNAVLCHKSFVCWWKCWLLRRSINARHGRSQQEGWSKTSKYQ